MTLRRATIHIRRLYGFILHCKPQTVKQSLLYAFPQLQRRASHEASLHRQANLPVGYIPGCSSEGRRLKPGLPSEPTKAGTQPAAGTKLVPTSTCCYHNRLHRLQAAKTLRSSVGSPTFKGSCCESTRSQEEGKRQGGEWCPGATGGAVAA